MVEENVVNEALMEIAAESKLPHLATYDDAVRYGLCVKVAARMTVHRLVMAEEKDTDIASSVALLADALFGEIDKRTPQTVEAVIQQVGGAAVAAPGPLGMCPKCHVAPLIAKVSKNGNAYQQCSTRKVKYEGGEWLELGACSYKDFG